MGSLRSRQSTRGLSNRPADARGRLSCHDGALLLGGSDGQAISTRTLLGRLGHSSVAGGLRAGLVSRSV